MPHSSDSNSSSLEGGGSAADISSAFWQQSTTISDDEPSKDYAEGRDISSLIKPDGSFHIELRRFRKVSKESAKPPAASKQVNVNVKLDEEDRISLTIDGRPPSSVSSKVQGDHSSAYALLKPSLLLNDRTVQESFEVMSIIIDSLIDNNSAQKITDFMKEELTKINEKFLRIVDISDLEKQVTGTSLQGQVSLMQDLALKELQREKCDVLENTVNMFMTERNKEIYTSFAREEGFAAGKDEGSKVRDAISKLEKISNDLLAEAPEEMHMTDDLKARIVQHMSDLFFYPRIPDDKIAARGSLEIKIKEKGYRSVEAFRDNDLDKFSEVIATHLGSVFDKFKGLTGENQEGIATCFIETYIAQNNWISEFSVQQGQAAAQAVPSSKPFMGDFIASCYAKVPEYIKEFAESTAPSSISQGSSSDNLLSIKGEGTPPKPGEHSVFDEIMKQDPKLSHRLQSMDETGSHSPKESATLKPGLNPDISGEDRSASPSI